MPWSFCVCLHLSGLGWRAAVRPADHPVANFEFDVVVGADGRRNTLEGEEGNSKGALRMYFTLLIEWDIKLPVLVKEVTSCRANVFFHTKNM